MTRLPATHANRGMALESLINHTNLAYLHRGIAVIHKRPTPVKILRTQGTRVTAAVLEAPSTVDYHGVYKGHALEFEAKSTKETSRFPLDNIHAHQVEHIRSCMVAGAICFVILEFANLHEIFYVPGKLVVEAWDKASRGERKSIPYDDVARLCHMVKATRAVPLDYLDVVDKIIESKAV